MQFLLSYQQLAAATFLAAFFLVLTFSRRSYFPLQPLLVFGSGVLVVVTTVWNFYLQATIWIEWDTNLRPSYLGAIVNLLTFISLIVSLVLFLSGIVSLISFRDRTMRVRIAYFLGALLISTLLVYIAFLPVRLQAALDSIPLK